MFARGLGARTISGLLLGVVLISIVWFAPAGAAASASRRQPSAALASRLARAIDGAKTLAGRTKAILKTVEALGYPVVAAKTGKAINSGAANMPAGLLLYDFELRDVATELGADTRLTVDELAAQLSKFGLRPGGNDLDPAVLRRALTAGVAAAVRKPRAPASFVGLLLRDLGLDRRHGRFDLASKSTPPAAFQLDAMQSLVLTTDLAIGAHRAVRRSADGPAAKTASTPCNGLDTLKTTVSGGKFGLGLIGGTASQATRLVTVIIEMPHGMVMALSITADPTVATSQSSHYGPADGHDPDAGKVLKLGVRVFNVLDNPPLYVDCGPLAGVKFPPHGPIKQVPVLWFGPGSGGLFGGGSLGGPVQLGNYGTVDYQPGLSTGGDGIATLQYTPKDEQLPGFGTVLTAKNTDVSAEVEWGVALGSITASLANVLAPLKVSYQVKVTAHVPAGFEFTTPIYSFTESSKPPAEVDFAVHGHICGPDPYAGPWQMDEGVTATSPQFGTTSVTKSYNVTLYDHATVYTGSDVVHKWELDKPAGPYPSNPFQLQLTMTPNQSMWNGGMTPAQIQQSANVTEDTGDCGAPFL